jgi:predicted transport protein
VSKHFSIDWWILGFGVGTSKIDIRAKETTGNLKLSAQEQLDLRNDITNNLSDLGRFSNGAVDITITDNSFRTVIKGIPMTSFRGFGLNLGFAF